MKKLFFFFKDFIIRHYKMCTVVSVFIILVSGIAMVYSTIPLMAALSFSASIICLFRIVTYKKGKILFFMHDTLWDYYRIKHSGEELEEKYKQTSINRATIFFILTAFSFVLWIFVELVLLITKLL